MSELNDLIQLTYSVSDTGSHFHIFLLGYANFFKLRVQDVHKSLFAAGESLRIMIQRRSRFGMAKLFGT